MGSPCAADAPYTSRVWCCTMLLGPALHQLLDAAPYGPELFVLDPDATIEHFVQGGEWESYQWTGEHQPAIQREVWSTRDLPPAYQEPDRIVWCAYSGGDECCDDAFDTLDEGMAWLRAHPAGEWVEACAVGPSTGCWPWCRIDAAEVAEGDATSLTVQVTVHYLPTADGATPLPDAWCAPDGSRPATADDLAVLRG